MTTQDVLSFHANIRELVKRGHSVSAIVSALECSRTTVYEGVSQQRKNEDIVVGSFRPPLDAKGHGGAEARLYHDVEVVEVAGEVPGNQLLADDHLANQHSGVLKRRSSLERKLAGEIPEAASPGD
jgi:hypothetical protein